MTPEKNTHRITSAANSVNRPLPAHRAASKEPPMSTRKTLLSLAALVVALAGLSPSAQGQSTLKAPPGAILIKGAGATFPSLLYEKWFQQYHKLHPEVVVALRACGQRPRNRTIYWCWLRRGKARGLRGERCRHERRRNRQGSARGAAHSHDRRRHRPGLQSARAQGPAQTEPRRIHRHLPREDQELERSQSSGNAIPAFISRS